MKLNASGLLRHRFWGEYSAVVGLRFECAADALLALPVISRKSAALFPNSTLDSTVEQAQRSDWQINAAVLVGVFTSQELESVKVLLGEFGADVEKIDSCAKSIDYGEPFAICVEVDDPKQEVFAL